MNLHSIFQRTAAGSGVMVPRVCWAPTHSLGLVMRRHSATTTVPLLVAWVLLQRPTEPICSQSHRWCGRRMCDHTYCHSMTEDWNNEAGPKILMDTRMCEQCFRCKQPRMSSRTWPGMGKLPGGICSPLSFLFQPDKVKAIIWMNFYFFSD